MAIRSCPSGGPGRAVEDVLLQQREEAGALAVTPLAPAPWAPSPGLRATQGVDDHRQSAMSQVGGRAPFMYPIWPRTAIHSLCPPTTDSPSGPSKRRSR